MVVADDSVEGRSLFGVGALRKTAYLEMKHVLCWVISDVGVHNLALERGVLALKPRRLNTIARGTLDADMPRGDVQGLYGRTIDLYGRVGW